MICRWSNAGILALLIAACGLIGAACGQKAPPSPAGPLLYTAAGSVTALMAEPNGGLWAATRGGVLCWASEESTPRRWTVAEGLTGNDVRALSRDGDGVLVRTSLGQDRITALGAVTHPTVTLPEADRTVYDGRQSWAITPQGLIRPGDSRLLAWPEATQGNVTGMAATGHGLFLATSLGFWRWAQGGWRPLPLPPGSPASHVSAVTADSQGILAGLYGDGIYRWSAGGSWQRISGQPAVCRWPTALTQTAAGLAVGTRADGVWRERDGHWQAYRLPLTLPSTDFNSLAIFGGALWATSFDEGLLRVTDKGAQSITRANGLRTDSPRGLVTFAGMLYVRHADGPLDCSADGVTWHPAFTKADLPRPDVYALATDDRRLLLGGWAGWAATDGHTWEQHDHDPELQGQVVTAIAAQGDAVWIGTQKRGLLRYEHGIYTAFQEPQGLTDDWITCLAVQGNRLLVGTYTGGLLEKQEDRFAVRLRAGSFAIRAIAFDPDSTATLAATPQGLYREILPGQWRLIDPQQSGGTETQAALCCAGGAWVATRTGLAFVPRRTLVGTAQAHER